MPLLLNSFLLGNKPPEPPQRHARAPARFTETPLGLEDSRKGAERGGGRPLPIRFQHHFSLPSICTSDSSLYQSAPLSYCLLFHTASRSASLWDPSAQVRGPGRREQRGVENDWEVASYKQPGLEVLIQPRTEAGLRAPPLFLSAVRSLSPDPASL